MKSVFKVGDTVEVIDSGKGYTTYISFFAEHDMEDLRERYIKYRSVPECRPMSVVAVKEIDFGKTLAVLQENDTIYLVDERGCRLIDRPNESPDTLRRIHRNQAKIELLNILKGTFDTTIVDQHIVAVPIYKIDRWIQRCYNKILEENDGK